MNLRKTGVFIWEEGLKYEALRLRMKKRLKSIQCSEERIRKNIIKVTDEQYSYQINIRFVEIVYMRM